MMIRLVAQDSECPVELLDEDEAHQFVGKCHLAEGYFLIGALMDFGRESVRSSYDKH